VVIVAVYLRPQQCKLSPYHTENKEVSIPTTAGTESRLGQSSLHDPENQEASVPSAASVVRTPSIIDSFKSFFGVKKEVNIWCHVRIIKHHMYKKNKLLPLCVLAPPFPGRYCSKGQRSSRVLLPSKTSMYIALYVRNV
jgi:hypothetical protein